MPLHPQLVGGKSGHAASPPDHGWCLAESVEMMAKSLAGGPWIQVSFNPESIFQGTRGVVRQGQRIAAGKDWNFPRLCLAEQCGRGAECKTVAVVAQIDTTITPLGQRP
jgi:hypothetical protein